MNLYKIPRSTENYIADIYAFVKRLKARTSAEYKKLYKISKVKRTLQHFVDETNRFGESMDLRKLSTDHTLGSARN